MIVKVQISLNDGGQHVLIYNQSRSVEQHLPMTPEIKDFLGNTPKAYYRAVVVDDELQLLERVPDQDW